MNLLFYVTFSLNKEEINKYIDEILLYIKSSEVFDLDEETIEEYKKCILDPPNISIITDINGNQKHYLRKHRCGISVERFNELYFKFLPSFINDLFKASLEDFEEPKLLNGSKGYKTFLAQQFIPDIGPINFLNKNFNLKKRYTEPDVLEKNK